MKQYVPTHVHSDFSVGDSILIIDEYVKWAKANEFKTICLSDHGNMSGALYFNQRCLENSLKSAIGVESYCLYKADFLQCLDEEVKEKPKREHLVFIAKNRKGYNALLKLLGNAARETFYHRPIVLYEDLQKCAGDIIVTSGCTAGRIQSKVIAGNEQESNRFAIEMQDVFGDDFYFEIMENDLKEQRFANDWMLKSSKRLGIKCIWTTDSHYLKPEHNVAHDVLKLNLQKLSFNTPDWKEKVYTSRHLSLKTRDEVVDEAIKKGYDADVVHKLLDNTFEIDEKIESYKLKSDKVYMPKFSDNSFKELCDRVKKSLVEKNLNTNKYVERLKHELTVIKAKNMEDYFLIVADIVDFANRSDIFVGAGRGSGGGSLVVYLLGITKIDPIKYDLLFERMLNMQRKDPPDIDLDFDSRGRYKIEEYLKGKYGIKSVSHIISFGRFGIKGALRDTFRVFYDGELRAQLEKCTSYIADDEDDFDSALRTAVKLGGSVVDTFFTKYKKEVDVARVLVGRNRHYSLHAGGVVISNGDLENYIPVSRVNDNIVAGLQEGADNRLITDAGLMKFDILGLNACSILHDAFELLKGKVTFEDIINDDNNEEVLELFRKANTFGVFQFEGRKITEFVKEVYPKNFEDLVAINALYRPAVITAGGLDKYIKNKIRFDEHTSDPFERVLKNTYGVPVYQEQIMQVFHELGNLTLEEADEARHTLKLLFKGKDDYTDFNILMEKFSQGCHKTTNYSDEKIKDVMDVVKQFSQYSFNRSHSCAYAMMGYAMQYLKHFYPLEYFSALLSNTDNSDTKQDKMEVNMLRNYIMFMQDLNEGITIKKPDVNLSTADTFKISGSDLIFPLGQIKGVGINAAIEIVSKQPFTSFDDFINRVEKRKANKRVVKALVKAGALKFDDTSSGYKELYKEEITGCEIRNSFEVMNILLGDELKPLFKNKHLCLKDIKKCNSIVKVKLFAFIYKLRPIVTKKNRKMNFLTLYDGTAILDDCMASSFEGLEDGCIIECSASKTPSTTQKYSMNVFRLENIKVHMPDGTIVEQKEK